MIERDPLPPANPNCGGLHLTDVEWQGLQRFVEEAKAIEGVVWIAIYGSRLTGTSSAESGSEKTVSHDVDIGIQLDPDLFVGEGPTGEKEAWVWFSGPGAQLRKLVEKIEEFELHLEYHGRGARSDEFRKDCFVLWDAKATRDVAERCPGDEA